MRPLDDSTNGLEESAFAPISELEFTQIKNQYVALLETIDALDDQIKAAREKFEASIAGLRAERLELEAKAQPIKTTLIQHAYQNYRSSGNKTFAGVQYRETKKIRYDDETRQVLEGSLQFEEVKGKPVIKTILKVDDTVLKQWVEMRQSMNMDVPPGVVIEVEPTIAIVKDK